MSDLPTIEHDPGEDDAPPKDYIEGAIDVFCVVVGFSLIMYLKNHYGSDLGDWILSLFG